MMHKINAVLLCRHLRCHNSRPFPAATVLISDFGCADDEAAGDDSDGEHNPSPNVDTQAGHPKGT